MTEQKWALSEIPGFCGFTLGYVCHKFSRLGFVTLGKPVPDMTYNVFVGR